MFNFPGVSKIEIALSLLLPLVRRNSGLAVLKGPSSIGPQALFIASFKHIFEKTYRHPTQMYQKIP